jgi:uncharacterized membrane protein
LPVREINTAIRADKLSLRFFPVGKNYFPDDLYGRRLMSFRRKIMKKYDRIFQILFAIPWLVFGVQHFMYAEFVATLVPAFMPLKLFWAYFTGTAMIAAGISFIVNKFSKLAAILLGLMLTGFILLIHISVVSGNPAEAKVWTRPVQDIALAAACFLLAGRASQPGSSAGILAQIVKISRYVFAAMLIAFGVQQFLKLDFMTAQVPAFLPLRSFWVYLTGIALIVAGVSVIINKKARLAGFALGIWLLVINLLNYIYLLANDLHNPVLWTGAMINFAITFGVFILASSLPED